MSTQSDAAPLKVVLCWHMHQPEYRLGPQGEYVEPWTYLHGIKDYSDMAWHLEANADARAVVNFSPVLLEQIDDYSQQIRTALDDEQRLRDPILRALQGLPPREQLVAREALVAACLRAQRERVVARFPDYELLHRIGEQSLREGTVRYLDDAFLADLTVWYALAWMGESVRHGDLRAKQLTDKGRGFDVRDRRMLLELIGELMSGLIPRYRALAEQGRVELSCSPYAHPILPLLIDWQSARDAIPDIELPDGTGYPDGAARAGWHVAEARRVFERFFGRPPAGCWPSEGGVSEAAVALLAEHGFSWTASGQGVLHNSLSDGQEPGEWSHRALRVEGIPSIRCFFRDDGLSDRIGFDYASWDAGDAVNDFVHHLENIAAMPVSPGERVVSIIMDGENAWESYPENGRQFLARLYRKLCDHPALTLTTFSDCLQSDGQVRQLDRLASGSWVYGSFSTWIGDPQKNRAWEMLAAAGEAVSTHLDSPVLTARARAAIEHQLAICEGSDWCWWFGDYNGAESVRSFDTLYRAQLSRLYELIAVAPPGSLDEPFTHGSGSPEAGGTMRRGA